jgi:hypothetical protein
MLKIIADFFEHKNVQRHIAKSLNPNLDSVKNLLGSILSRPIICLLMSSITLNGTWQNQIKKVI